MSESENNNNKQELDPGLTAKMSINSTDVEVTQKIEVDYEKVIDESKKETLATETKNEQKSITESLLGKTIFNRKRIADDYVKSSTIISMIGEVPPLKDKLELQDVNSNYELKNQLAEGSQGIIRNAFDKSLKRNIIVKSLKVDEDEEYARKDEALFVSEARIMAQLDHPSIIPLYGLHSGNESKLHLAMKHIHGKTLKQYLEDIIDLYEREGIDDFDEERSIATRIGYLIKVCEAIDYSHCKGVVHRDLKPENIMIGNYGEAYVMDWGLACLVEPEKFSEKEHHSEVSRFGKSELVGTPCYIAPEMIRGGPCSVQSDIFALGMILFEIVALQRAVSGKTVKKVLKNIVNGNYRPFKHRFHKNKLSDDLKAIIRKATCESLSHRYKSAKDMARDLRLYLMREETSARPDNIFRKCMRAMVNHKMITLIAVLVILLTLAGSTIHSLYTQNTLIIAQKEREDMLAYFQDYASQRTNKMERIFLYLKNQLKNTAYRAGRVLNSNINTTEKIYEEKDFLKKITAPADYTFALAYDMKISLDYAVIKPGAGTKTDNELNKKVVRLQDVFKYIMFTSSPDFEYMTKKSIKNIITTKGAPLIWIYIALENGSMFSFPGKPYKKGYDPRKRPWYKSAIKQKKYVTWSKPYMDASKLNIVISCMQCVNDNKNNFLGVIAMDISLNYIQEYMFNKKASSVLKEYLLNKNAQVILSSDFQDKNARISKRATLVMKKFHFYEELQKAIKDEKVNFVAMGNGIKYIFTLNKLPSLEYYHIQQVKEKDLRKHWEESISHKNK
jgi:eukaryotic-like serine/threonine-protein kinase